MVSQAYLGIRSRLQMEPGFEVIGEAASADEALGFLEEPPKTVNAGERIAYRWIAAPPLRVSLSSFTKREATAAFAAGKASAAAELRARG